MCFVLKLKIDKNIGYCCISYFFMYLSFCQKFITPSTFLNLSYITDPHFMSFTIQSMVEFNINCTILLFNCFSPQVAVSWSSCELTCSTCEFTCTDVQHTAYIYWELQVIGQL